MINFNKDEIKESLTIDQIEQFLADHGGDPVKRIGCLVSRTICHNLPTDDASHKLYYYENTKLFKCYTECAETQGFDIFDLVRKIMKITSGVDWSLYDAQLYVINYFSLDVVNDFQNDTDKISDFAIFDKYERNNKANDKQKTVELKIFDKSVLDHLQFRVVLPWVRDGISVQIMKDYGILYDPYSMGVVIPHFDINDNLVGIRERTLVKEYEVNGKYMPAILNGKMYNHPLGFNLYNINRSKENIKRFKIAIVGEGEKFCLGFASYFGEEADITVACCGSNLTWYQFQLLLSLGVEEIVIAFDKQFQTIGDKEWKRWTKKLTEISNKYNPFVKISFMFDTSDLLGYKESPVDGGKEICQNMFEHRIVLG